jgi:hypothetical protein
MEGLLHDYTADWCASSGADEINGMAEHVHLLVGLRPPIVWLTCCRTSALRRSGFTTKSACKFAWQTGYGGFTVSPSQLEAVREYIRTRKLITRKIFRRDVEFLKNSVPFAGRSAVLMGGADLGRRCLCPRLPSLPLREEQLCEGIDLASLHFPVAEAADFSVGFDGLCAVRASAGAHQVTEGPFFKGSLVVFNLLLDALRIPLGGRGCKFGWFRLKIQSRCQTRGLRF